jgi:hypothetical protein
VVDLRTADTPPSPTPLVDGRHRPTVHGSPGSGRVAVVLKWLFEVGNEPRHSAWPADAQVVHVAPDADPAKPERVWVWTLHTQPDDDTGPQIRFRWIQLFGTGQPIPVPSAHLGTAVTPSGLVWHLVEVL